MTYSATTIADWFLAKADECGDALTPMKLLKLIYIAHGFHLGATSRPLIRERVEAWRWGPVIPDIYARFSKYGSSGIAEHPTVPRVDEQAEEVLEAVWDVYGGETALRLSALTHLPDTPWSTTYDERLGRVIPNDRIQSYYAEMLGDG